MTTMAKPTFTGQREPVNVIHQQAILNETIKKEMRHHKFTTNFTINPFRPMHTVTGKPNSFQEAETNEIKGDSQMIDVINRSRKPPTEKYLYPQTTSQEYGWITQPLIDTDKSDPRLYFTKKSTDVTQVKEAQWKLHPRD